MTDNTDTDTARGISPAMRQAIDAHAAATNARARILNTYRRAAGRPITRADMDNARAWYDAANAGALDSALPMPEWGTEHWIRRASYAAALACREDQYAPTFEAPEGVTDTQCDELAGAVADYLAAVYDIDADAETEYDTEPTPEGDITTAAATVYGGGGTARARSLVHITTTNIEDC